MRTASDAEKRRAVEDLRTHVDAEIEQSKRYRFAIQRIGLAVLKFHSMGLSCHDIAKRTKLTITRVEHIVISAKNGADYGQTPSS